MRRPLYALGEVPVTSTDPVLERTRATADALIVWMRRQPPREGLHRLLAALHSFDPKLPDTVMRAATSLRARGYTLEAAVREAIARGIADSSIDRIQALGRAARSGMPMSGLGQTTTGTTSTPPEQVLGNTLRSLMCSSATQKTITDLVAKQNNTDANNATTLGIAAGQGAAQCATLNQPPTPPAPPPPPATPPSVFAGYGLAVAVLAGVTVLGYFAIKHRPKAIAAAA